MKQYLLHFNKNIKESLLQLEQNNEKCLLVVDSNNILKGTLTDGDIRRALLGGADINSKIKKYIKKSLTLLNLKILMRLKKIPKKEYSKLNKKIKDEHIDIIPILDKKHKVKDIIFVKNFDKFALSKKKFENVPLLIMAGGKGTRLKPLQIFFQNL